MSNKARFFLLAGYALFMNGAWAAVQFCMWKASIDLEVDETFAAWLTVVGSAIVFLCTGALFVFGTISLLQEDTPKEPTAPKQSKVLEVHITEQINTSEAVDKDRFALGFLVGSITTALLGMLMRRR